MNTEAKHRFWRIVLVTGATLVSLLAIAAGLGVLTSAAPAATPIYVRKDGDDVNCNGTVNAPYPGGGPGLQCAVKTIQTGIGLVDPGGTVIVAGGVYGENVDITKDLTLQGAGAGSTTIDAGSVGRGIHIDTSVDTTVSGFTIRNGSAYDGAGIYVSGGGAFTLTNSTISNNTCSGGQGGGLYLGDGTTAFISGCSFVNNTGSSGGAISSYENTLTIVGSTFTGNEATDSGGAIHNTGHNGKLTVIESTISNNAVARQGGGGTGGGVRHNQGTLVISNTTIANNTTTWAGGGVGLGIGTARIVGSAITGNSGNNTTSCLGGGVYNSNSTLTIEDSVVRDNWVSTTLSSSGGGIWSNGRTTLNRVTVSGNSSTGYAGGIHSQNELTMTNVTVSGNAAFYTGGLVQTGSLDGTFVNCTIVDNTRFGPGSASGGMFVYSTVNMTNTLLANNESDNCYIQGTMNSGGHNLEDGNSCNLGATGDITNADPLLFPLADFGGPSVGAPGSKEQMRLHAVSWGSPAIDAGDDAACPAVDQRGISRPVDGDEDGTATCDIGAFEFDGLDTVFLPLVLRDH